MAMASGSSAWPKSPPSDRFTTSMPSAWRTLYAATHSSAEMTMSVEVEGSCEQPKTLSAISLACGATPGPMTNLDGSL